MKENENANARPSRISTRTKPLVQTTTTSSIGGVTRATVASRAKASAADNKNDIPAGKRKREALGEVTVPNNKPVGLAGKGKEKEKEKEKETLDDVVIKAKGVTTRAPLRTVAATRQATKASLKESIGEENAMAVDPPTQAALPSITVRRSSLVKETLGITRQSDLPHRASRYGLVSKQRLDEDFEGDQPAHKKRRTSSVPPEDDPFIGAQAEEEGTLARITAEMEAFAELPEADPESSPWDDLDAVDTNDPLMVSEYVQEIFQYLKNVEVC